jgi:hypothetical protein
LSDTPAAENASSSPVPELAPELAPAPAGPLTAPAAAQGLRVNVSELKSSYCNVCNANSTREEVVLNFGASHDWDRGQNGEVRLTHRIILSPQAARRVADLLNRVVQDYEARFGSLS